MQILFRTGATAAAGRSRMRDVMALICGRNDACATLARDVTKVRREIRDIVQVSSFSRIVTVRLGTNVCKRFAVGGLDEITTFDSVGTMLNSSICHQQFPTKRTISRFCGTKTSREKTLWLPGSEN